MSKLKCKIEATINDNNNTTASTADIIKAEPPVIIKTEPKIAANYSNTAAVGSATSTNGKRRAQDSTNTNSASTASPANTMDGYSQALAVTNNNYDNNNDNSKIKSRRDTNFRGKKRTQDAANINDDATTATSTRLPKRKKKNKNNKKKKAPTPVNRNKSCAMQAMPDITLPIFVIDRIRATKIADGWYTTATSNNNPNRTTTPQTGPMSLLTSYTSSSQYPFSLGIGCSTNVRGSMTAHVPAPPLVTPELSVPAPVPVSTATSILAPALVPPVASTPAPALVKAPAPSVNLPSSASSTPIVVDLTKDAYEHLLSPNCTHASSQIDNFIEQFQRNLEERQDEMNLWCSKMSQLMMDAPNLIKDAGQGQSGEAEARALAAAETLFAYGKSVLASCFDACEAVQKKFIGSVQDATDTVSGSTSTAASKSR